MPRNKAKTPPADVRARDVEIISRTEFEVLGQVVRPQDLEQGPCRACGGAKRIFDELVLEMTDCPICCA